MVGTYLISLGTRETGVEIPEIRRVPQITPKDSSAPAGTSVGHMTNAARMPLELLPLHLLETRNSCCLLHDLSTQY